MEKAAEYYTYTVSAIEGATCMQHGASICKLADGPGPLGLGFVSHDGRLTLVCSLFDKRFVWLSSVLLASPVIL
jgi:hypothetical protein